MWKVPSAFPHSFAGKPFFTWWNGTRMHFRTHVKDELRGISGQDEYSDVLTLLGTRTRTAISVEINYLKSEYE
jgi:hypothetical protein